MGSANLIKIKVKTLKAHGFTLIELLIAITLMAFIGLIGYQTLDVIMSNQDNLNSKRKQLFNINKTYNQWQLDCQNLNNYNIKGYNPITLMLNQNTQQQTQLLLIKQLSNTNQHLTSQWQLILYYLYGNKLLRRSFKSTNNSNMLLQQIQNLDNFKPNPDENMYKEQILLNNVQKLDLMLWNDEQQQWINAISNKSNNLSQAKGLRLDVKLKPNLNNKDNDKNYINYNFSCLRL